MQQKLRERLREQLKGKLRELLGGRVLKGPCRTPDLQHLFTELALQHYIWEWEGQDIPRKILFTTPLDGRQFQYCRHGDDWIYEPIGSSTHSRRQEATSRPAP